MATIHLKVFMALSLALASAVSSATVFPIKGVIEKSNTQIFYVDNTNATDTKEYTIEIKKWGPGDALTDTSDVVIFPTKVTAKPGKKYAVKVLSKGERGDVQKTYRVLFSYKTLNASPKAEQQVDINFGYSIPLFVEATGAKTTTVVKAVKAGKVDFTNMGNSTFKTNKITVDGKTLDRLTYILPGDTLTLEGSSVELGPVVD